MYSITRGDEMKTIYLASFLAERGALEKFKANNARTFTHHNPRDWISWAFLWNGSIGNHCYWSELHCEWENIVRGNPDAKFIYTGDKPCRLLRRRKS